MGFLNAPQQRTYHEEEVEGVEAGGVATGRLLELVLGVMVGVGVVEVGVELLCSGELFVATVVSDTALALEAPAASSASSASSAS